MVFETLSYPFQLFGLQNERFQTFLAFPHEAAAQAAFWHGDRNCLQCGLLFCFPCILSSDAQCVVGSFVYHYTLIERIQRTVGGDSRIQSRLLVQSSASHRHALDHLFLLFTTCTCLPWSSSAIWCSHTQLSEVLTFVMASVYLEKLSIVSRLEDLTVHFFFCHEWWIKWVNQITDAWRAPGLTFLCP